MRYEEMNNKLDIKMIQWAKCMWMSMQTFTYAAFEKKAAIFKRSEYLETATFSVSTVDSMHYCSMFGYLSSETMNIL